MVRKSGDAACPTHLPIISIKCGLHIVGLCTTGRVKRDNKRALFICYEIWIIAQYSTVRTGILNSSSSGQINMQPNVSYTPTEIESLVEFVAYESKLPLTVGKTARWIFRGMPDSSYALETIIAP